jgi:hypothetical protein
MAGEGQGGVWEERRPRGRVDGSVCQFSQIDTRSAPKWMCQSTQKEMFNVAAKNTARTLQFDTEGEQNHVDYLGEEMRDGSSQLKTKGKWATQRQLMELIEQQEFKCAMSGRLLTPTSAALDHIQPIANGGTHRIDNLQWVDSEINRMKGKLTVSEFISICQSVVDNMVCDGQKGPSPK